MKLWQQILLGMILGIVVGALLRHYNIPQYGADVKILGTIFINLIKMVVVPLIFLALVSGITSMDDPKNFKRVGIKGISAYLLTATFAVILGIVSAAIFKPGLGLNLDIATMAQNAGGAAVAQGETPTLGKFLLDLIPTNALRAMTEDHFLQVIVFSIFVGLVMNSMGEKARHAKTVVHEFAQVTFKMIETIVKLAPIAAFGFIAWMVTTQGMDVIVSLGKLILVVLFACALQYIIFGLLILFFARLNPIPFYKKMAATQSMAFATSSSKATLTTAMRELNEKLGVSTKSTNFLMPLGACINMDGTAIYLGICSLFFAQIYGIELDFYHYMILILTSTLGSIGAAGIPSGSIIFMSMVLSSVGLPVEGIALIVGIDRILDMVRTTINITGDATITLIVDKTEGELNVKRYYAKDTSKV